MHVPDGLIFGIAFATGVIVLVKIDEWLRTGGKQ